MKQLQLLPHVRNDLKGTPAHPAEGIGTAWCSCLLECQTLRPLVFTWSVVLSQDSRLCQSLCGKRKGLSCLFSKRRRLSVHSALVIINLDYDQFQMIHGWNVCIRTGPWCLRLKAWNSSDVEHMGTLGAPLNKLKSLGPHPMAMPKYGLIFDNFNRLKDECIRKEP